MTSTPSSIPSRRSFLKGLGMAAGAGVTMAALPQAAFPQPAAGQGGARSLVCIFLYGGADSFNLYVPRDHNVAGQDHATYRATRGGFAVPAGDLLGIHDGAFGLNPGLPGLAAIAASNRLAVVQNVGPLIRPTTRADFLGSVTMPQSLFAHDAQQKLWQTGRPKVSLDTGWGGAIASASAGGLVAPAFSLGGSIPWLSSESVGYSRLSSTVSIERMLGYDASLRGWIDSFEGLQSAMEIGLSEAGQSTNPFDQAASESIDRAVTVTEQLQDVTQNTDVGMDVNPRSLGGRLETIAKLIAARDQLGMSRQVFFVGLGGWDTHGDQAGRFPALMEEFDSGVAAFQDALDNNLRVADSVTTFTASDFGRTLTSNGDGTDHAWGGNAFVWGGAVSSGRYGTFPSLSITNNPDDTTDERGNFAGRLIPTTSIAQYGATLGKWMGLGPGQLDQAFPELANFETTDLGFLG